MHTSTFNFPKETGKRENGTTGGRGVFRLKLTVEGEKYAICLVG